MSDKIPYLKREVWDDEFRVRAEEQRKRQGHWALRKNRVVPLFLVLNIVVFLGWQFFTATNATAGFFYNNFLVSPLHIKAGYYWTLLTAAFSHENPFHLVFNMMVLFSFGGLLEKFFGMRRFLTLYLGAALFSSIMHCATSAFLIHKMDTNALGASGALTAVLMVFAMVWPKQKILLFGLIPVPALLGVGGLVLLDIWGLVAQTRGGGLPIGHSAHLGGSVFGFCYFWFAVRPYLVRSRD